MPHNTERPAQRMCLDCHTMTTTPVLLYAIERASGPAFPVYACPTCAPAHLDQPTALNLIAEHCRHCAICSKPDSICPMGQALVRVHSACLRKLRITKSGS